MTLARVKAAIERTAGAALPVRFWEKLFRYALRRAHRGGDQFPTYHARPKRADGVGVWSDRRPDLPTVAVVLQGPLLLVNDFTVETVRLYRRTFAGCPLIVSTWEGEDAAAVARLRDAGAEVLLNRKPSFAGFKNTNLQLVSSLAGVRRAQELGAEFVLKTRTDQRMYAPNVPAFLVATWTAFPAAPGYRQRGRLIGSSLGSHKYIMYQFSDMNVFGHVADVLEYWSCPHTKTAGLPPDHKNVLSEVARANPPEQHIVGSYLRSIGKPIEWSLPAYWQSLADHFAIVDRAALDLVWFKISETHEHPRPRYAGIEALHELTFAEWLNLCVGLSGKDAVPHHEMSQSLSGGSLISAPQR
ncbi:WavE lipopolysaccharide synthesis family protein [Gemmata sp.]|uniref:WavE lipopolysaccharide synthesis family protein n=1 Tax=Gemmata sp. TaxID=1914242 RepID=UPI003F720D2C